MRNRIGPMPLRKPSPPKKLNEHSQKRPARDEPALGSGKIPAETRAGEAKALMRSSKSEQVVLTIGHSTRAIEEFIHLLKAHGVTRVVDVRTVPRSRHNPQFNRDTLPASLMATGVGYTHMPELGGLRHTTAASINTGWRNTSFRGYADYMQTPAFTKALDELIKVAGEDRVALMCAEAVPWRCHRSLIADALLVRGIRSEDIMSATRREVHSLTPFAKVVGLRLTYPTETVTPKKP
jgi:uncharacterized protein (DUF488 family)